MTRSALQNAASIAALFLTTEAVVADKPEKAAPAAPGGVPTWAAWTSESSRYRQPPAKAPSIRSGPSSVCRDQPSSSMSAAIGVLLVAAALGDPDRPEERVPT